MAHSVEEGFPLPLSQNDFLQVVQSTRFLLRPVKLKVPDAVDAATADGPLAACLLSCFNSPKVKWSPLLWRCFLFSEADTFLLDVVRKFFCCFPPLFTVEAVAVAMVDTAEKSVG